MSNIFYVLTEGDYDEYHILGVFDENGMKKKRMTYLDKAKNLVRENIRSCIHSINTLGAELSIVNNSIELDTDRNEVIRQISALKSEKGVAQAFGDKREVKRINKEINALEAQKNIKYYQLDKIQSDIDAFEKEKDGLVNMSDEEMLNYYFEHSYEGLNFTPYELNECEDGFCQDDYDDED